MQTSTIESLFAQAASHDPSLRMRPGMLAGLDGLRVKPQRYNRETLFRNMADGKVTVFEDFPSPLKTAHQRKDPDPAGLVLRGYENSGIPEKIRIRTGRAKTEKYFHVGDIAGMWRRQRALMNVTDFHFRETDIQNTIDPKRLSRFNIYPRCTEDVASLEMMTLVISTVGGFSDSHSDDSDGSNHCFTGRKLWLAWDTHEGIAAGLEDLDRQDVYSACKFDLETWLSLKSSCWFTVETGQTLFMPGHLTHKVVTLEPYLGVGSFYVALPNCLRTLTRWILHTPNWENLERQGFADELYPDLVRRLVDRINRLDGSRSEARRRWGHDFLDYSVNAWKRQFSAAQRRRVLGSPFLQDPEAQTLRNLAQA